MSRYSVTRLDAIEEIDDDSHEAPAVTLLRVPAGVTRSAVARDAGTTVFAIGAGPRGVRMSPAGP